MKATVFQEHLEKNCRRCLELEPVFTRNICGFSSIILLQTRQKYAGGLSPGKCFSRSMQQNLPKRHVYTLVKTGSYIDKSCTQQFGCSLRYACTVFSSFSLHCSTEQPVKSTVRSAYFSYSGQRSS